MRSFASLVLPNEASIAEPCRKAFYSSFAPEFPCIHILRSKSHVVDIAGLFSSDTPSPSASDVRSPWITSPPVCSRVHSLQTAPNSAKKLLANA